MITTSGGAISNVGGTTSGYVVPQDGTAVQPPQSPACPNCGFCDKCGRGGHRAAPPYPYWPWYGPYYVGDPPYYHGYPYYRTITVSCDTAGNTNSQMATSGAVWT